MSSGDATSEAAGSPGASIPRRWPGLVLVGILVALVAGWLAVAAWRLLPAGEGPVDADPGARAAVVTWMVAQQHLPADTPITAEVSYPTCATFLLASSARDEVEAVAVRNGDTWAVSRAAATADADEIHSEEECRAVSS